MRLRHQHIYQGPSLINQAPVIRMVFSLDTEDNITQEQIHLAANRLKTEFPPVPQRPFPEQDPLHLFPDGEPKSIGEMTAQVALALQREFGFIVEFFSSRISENEVIIHFEYRDRTLGLLAGQNAFKLIKMALSQNPSQELKGQLSASIESLAKYTIGILNRRFIWEGERRGIPWARVHPNQPVIQMGQGHKQKWFLRNYTDQTAKLATELATAKKVTCDILGSLGVPVPQHFIANSTERAISTAEKLGYPVVVKPNKTDIGVAVTINIETQPQLLKAYEKARPYGDVLVEEQVTGKDYRVILFEGQIIAAAENIPTQVIGDGCSTIDELITQANASPNRGKQDFLCWASIEIDGEIQQTLREDQLSLQSIPPDGHPVILRRWWKTSKDRSAIDVTKAIHPLNKALFERVARLSRLDIAGVDFISPDISRPWTEVGGKIIEVNPTPGVKKHIRAGNPEIIAAILDGFFKPGCDGRIPTVATLGQTSTARAIADFIGKTWSQVGLATSQGASINNTVISQQDATGGLGAHLVLNDPISEAAVIQYSCEKFQAEGLGIDLVDIAAIIAPSREVAKNPTSLSTQQVYQGMSLITQAARKLIILNSEDPLCQSFNLEDKQVPICWIGPNSEDPLIAEHIKKGGMAITVSKEASPAIFLWQNNKSTSLGPPPVPEENLIDRLASLAVGYGLEIL